MPSLLVSRAYLIPSAAAVTHLTLLYYVTSDYIGQVRSRTGVGDTPVNPGVGDATDDHSVSPGVGGATDDHAVSL
jgi:hypothetical protein